MTKKQKTTKPKKAPKEISTVWINTRIEPTKRDAIDTFVEKGNYPSRSAFFRTAIDNQLEKELILSDAVAKVVA